MNIENAEDQLKKADSFLTTLGTILKKHWLILILIGLCALLYWAFTLPDVVDNTEVIDNAEPVVWEYDLDVNNDTIWYLNGQIQEYD